MTTHPRSGIMFFVITTGGLGFSLNPINAIKSVARVGARVITDPNVQRAARHRRATDRAWSVCPDHGAGQPCGGLLQAAQAAGAAAAGHDAASRRRWLPLRVTTVPPARAGVQQGNISKGILFIGAGLLVVFLLTKK